MRLTNVLDQSNQHGDDGSKPCIVLAQEGSTASFTLTYSAASLARNDHLEWLRQHTTPSTTAGTSMEGNILIAYLASNSTDMLLSILASTEISNAGVALLNTRWTTIEIVNVLQSHSLTDKTLILHDGDSQHTAQQVAKGLHHPVDVVLIPTISVHYIISTITDTNRNQFQLLPRITPPFNADHEIKSMLQKHQNDNDDDALIVFTSGTTSGSKGVRLSHTAILIQALAKCGPPCHCSTHTQLLATVPFFHVGGLSSALAVWLTGGTLVMPPAKGFKASFVVEAMTSQMTNTLVVVPAMLHAILQHLDHQQPTTMFPFFTIDLILIGGQSASPTMVQQLKTTFPKARLVQTYACTEAASSLTFSLLSDKIAIESNGDCVGYPPSHIDLCLVQQPCSEGQIIPIHEDRTVGIFATKGHHVMNGYWNNRNNEHHNFSTLRRNEWFLTNDLGFKVNGQFYFCGRTKDVIRTGGETVIAAEVERILLECHDIMDCAVFALPDDQFGEVVCAALVPKRDHHQQQQQQQPVVTLSQIRQFCGAKGLANYKRPRRLFHVKELPRNSSGKVLKFMLVDTFGSKQGNDIQSKL